MSPLHTDVLHLLKTTSMTQYEIADKVGCHQCTVSDVCRANLTKEEQRERTFTSKAGERHHAFKGGCVSTDGYKTVVRPSCYTGTHGWRVNEHTLVACKDAGITRLPHGHVVHHIDENKLNNNPNNLIIVSRANHVRIHRQIP